MLKIGKIIKLADYKMPPTFRKQHVRYKYIHPEESNEREKEIHMTW